jgi:excinuclease ABC subunit C
MKIEYLSNKLFEEFDKSFIDDSLLILKDFIQRNEASTSEILLENIQKFFKINKKIKNINIFDNSYFYTQYAMAGVVHWSLEADDFVLEKYKKMNFKTTLSDYEMMVSVLTKRLTDIKKNLEDIDLFLIDGGLPQKSAMIEAMKTANFEIDFICIAKGEQRNARDEVFFTKHEDYLKLEKDSYELRFLEKLRDEAHKNIIRKVRNKKNNEIFYKSKL